MISGTLIGTEAPSSPFAYARADRAACLHSAALLMRSRTVGGSALHASRASTPPDPPLTHGDRFTPEATSISVKLQRPAGGCFTRGDARRSWSVLPSLCTPSSLSHTRPELLATPRLARREPECFAALLWVLSLLRSAVVARSSRLCRVVMRWEWVSLLYSFRDPENDGFTGDFARGLDDAAASRRADRKGARDLARI